MTFFCVFFRWLDRNEDDGQIVRELSPAGDGLQLFSECKNNILHQERLSKLKKQGSYVCCKSLEMLELTDTEYRNKISLREPMTVKK